MCEALIRVVDKVNATDPYIDSKCLKRGDVVALVDDGWQWERQELTNPEWRIVKFPNIALAAAQGFLAPEVDTDPAHPSRVLRRRAFSFDLDNATLPAAFAAWLADDTRAAPTRTVNLSGAQLLALKRAKTRLVDPNIPRLT